MWRVNRKKIEVLTSSQRPQRDIFENKTRQSSAKNTNYKRPCARTDSHPNTETVTESVQDQDEQATTPLLNKSGAMLPHSVDTHAALVQKGNTLDSHENQDPQREEEEKIGSVSENGVGEQEKNLPTMAITPFHGAKELTLQTSATPGQVCIPTPLVQEPSQAQLEPDLSGPKQENKPDLDQPDQDTATSTEESNQQDLYTAEKKDENQLTPYTGEPKQETNYAKPEIKNEGERTVHSRPQIQEPVKSTHTGGQPGYKCK